MGHDCYVPEVLANALAVRMGKLFNRPTVDARFEAMVPSDKGQPASAGQAEQAEQADQADHNWPRRGASL